MSDTYAHGVQIDPDAERELREWARAKPCEEPEFGPVARRLDFPRVINVDEHSQRECERMENDRDPFDDNRRGGR